MTDQEADKLYLVIDSHDTLVAVFLLDTDAMRYIKNQGESMRIQGINSLDNWRHWRKFYNQIDLSFGG
jgi:hypothetical protein